MPEHESYQVVISKRAAQQLVEHAAFMARLDEKLAHKLVSDFRQAAASLERFPFRNPVMRSDVFVVEKYRKLIFDKYHILLYQIKGQVVYVEYVIDGRHGGGRIDRLLVKSISRFARNTSECLETIRQFRANGTTAFFEREYIQNGRNP